MLPGIKLARVLGIPAFLLMGLALRAEKLTISINQQTTFGDSVFVTTELPSMGGLDITKAVKLSPHEYPVWQADFDFPPGVSLTPRFYIRSDAAGDLPDAQNGTLASTGSPIATTADPTWEQEVTVIAAPTANSASISLTNGNSTRGTISIPMEVISTTATAKTFRATIPAANVVMEDDYRISVDGAFLPSSGSAGTHAGPVWWRHGQAFLHEPTDTAPVNPRTETFSFVPSNFQGRTIRVLLPRNYDVNTSKDYPVLYAQDGQNVFAPGGPFGSWDLDLSITDLIKRGDIPEIILVGVDNTSDRFAEYTPEYGNVQGTDGRGGEFLTMLRDELIPEINDRYRTLTGPENTSHIGSSLGGLLGFHAGNEFENVWGTVAAMSPSFQISLDENLNRASLPPAQWSRLWLDCGTSGTSSDGYANTIQVRDQFLESGFVIGHNFFHEVGNNQQHNEAAWRERSPRVLRWMFAPVPEPSTNGETAWIVGLKKAPSPQPETGVPSNNL